MPTTVLHTALADLLAERREQGALGCVGEGLFWYAHTTPPHALIAHLCLPRA
eukprot:COSAG02_NODE_2819_length_7966_cov_42.870726_1_plen_51_part_10